MLFIISQYASNGSVSVYVGICVAVHEIFNIITIQGRILNDKKSKLMQYYVGFEVFTAVTVKNDVL
jgi:hypothetical protein